MYRLFWLLYIISLNFSHIFVSAVLLLTFWYIFIVVNLIMTELVAENHSCQCCSGEVPTYKCYVTFRATNIFYVYQKGWCDFTPLKSIRNWWTTVTDKLGFSRVFDRTIRCALSVISIHLLVSNALYLLRKHLLCREVIFLADGTWSAFFATFPCVNLISK